MKEKTTKCKTCGTDTPMLGTKRCDACWEVEHRLEDYVKSTGGRIHMKEILRQDKQNRLRRSRIEAVRIGYIAGHNDTVESRYADPEEVAQDICQELDEEEMAT